MTRIDLSQMTVEQLVEQFAAMAVEQDQAELMNDNAKYTRLYWQMEAVENELKAREGDQRRALMRLYHHRNAQVRLKTAIATLAIAPELARQVLQVIKDRSEFPQAGDAAMMLRSLDNGSFTPS